MAKSQELTFETAMTELEEIIAKLEGGKASLDESIKLYEKGAELKAHCEKKLREAEGKWQLLRRKGNGEVTSEKLPAPETRDMF